MNIASWLISTVTVAPRTGADSHGMPTYGSQVIYQARIESANALTLAPTRPELKFDAVIILTSLINVDDRVWLPDDDTTSADAAKRPLHIDYASTKAGDFTLYCVYL